MHLELVVLEGAEIAHLSNGRVIYAEVEIVLEGAEIAHLSNV